MNRRSTEEAHNAIKRYEVVFLHSLQTRIPNRDFMIREIYKVGQAEKGRRDCGVLVLAYRIVRLDQ